MASSVAPRSSLLLIASALALGCAVGEGGSGFSSGPALTFGGGDASADGTADGSDETADDSATSMSSADGPSDSADGCTAELCNGMDDDCDGAVDNGDPEAGQPCETGSPGVCGAGATVCEDGALACAPTTAASAEVCNGLDDDCNGMVDDGSAGGGEACNTGMTGVCADGTLSCSGGAMECTPVTAPQAESCNGLDDDCNGTADDGNPGGGGACNTGLPGICAAGIQTCAGGMLSCQQTQGAAGSDTCNNGLDDDCDGQVDDGCNTCAHDICATGTPLVSGCDPCVTQVCGADPFCCNTMWDGLCVEEVGTYCGIVC